MVTTDLRRTRQRLAEVRSADHDPVAVVGMACRFPGGVESPEGLWDLVVSGGDGVGEFPGDRGWDLAALFDPDPDRLGCTYARAGGFLDRAAEFDAEFFGVSPREALAMDPQQRLLLEVSWEALERAGIDPTSVRGSRTGVFTGSNGQDYLRLLLNSTADAAGYLGVGTAGSVVSGRVSYVLGLEGPAVTLDTACSSSLVAMHLAGRSLRAGECDLALAGGATVMATPDTFVEFSRQRALSPDGRCKPFSAAADGTAWGEGVGVVVLERLSDARRNGHRVLAVVRGSAVNQDGASNGLTAPNGPAQQRVIRAALKDAGLSTADVDVVEAHGTGTRLGDPIEAQALLATYGQRDGAPLWLGSVKSNIGHTQAAAGIAGVIKMVMALRHGVFPRSLHGEQPSPEVDWSTGAVSLLAENVAWPAGDRPRRAAVSSFGISGTNAHLVLEEEESRREPIVDDRWSGLVPLAVSGRSAEGLRVLAQRLAGAVTALPSDVRPVDVAWSLANSRAGHVHRAVVLGRDRGDLVQGLSRLARDESTSTVPTGTARGGALVGVLSGQGGLRVGAGRELCREMPEFARHWAAARSAVEEVTGPGLERALWSGDPNAVVETGWGQPGLFALQVALGRLLAEWGVRPRWWVGHSVGEFAAVCLAGAVSLADAARLTAVRGALMRALPAGGAMIAVQATETEVIGFDGVEPAAVNSPRWVVLSGDADAVARAAEVWRGRGRRVRPLPVDHAFHSRRVEPMLAEFAAAVAAVRWREPEGTVVSTVTGRPLTLAQVSSPAYWTRHARDAVRFADAVEWVAGRGATTFVELGANAVLTPMVRDCVGRDGPPCVPVLRDRHAEPDALTTALATLHTHGHPVDWDARFRPHRPRLVDLPTHPFRRRRYWPQPAARSGAGSVSTGHPLLDTAVILAEPGTVVYTGELSTRTHPWLADHVVRGSVLFPGTGFLELALRAGQEVRATTVAELTVDAPLVLPHEGRVEVQVVVGDPDENGRRAVGVHARPRDTIAWTRHASGVLTLDHGPAAADPCRPPRDAEPVPVDDLYDRLAAAGFDYGDTFRGTTSVWRHGAELFAEVALPASACPGAAAFTVHPALLDAALHPLALGRFGAGGEPGRMPFAWRDVTWQATGATELHVRLAPAGPDAVSIAVADGAGRPVATVGALVLRPVPDGPLPVRTDVHRVRWEQLPAGAAPAARPPDLADLLADPAAPVPEVVVVSVPTGPASADTVRTVCRWALSTVRTWLAEPRFAYSRLVLRTNGAVAVRDGEVPDPAQAAVWGLVRAARLEAPGRLCLVDGPVVPASDVPEAAVRDGVVLAPRLVRAEVVGEVDWDPAGTLLVTGAAGALGRLVAEHVVDAWGVRHLVLLGRRGVDGEWVRALAARCGSVRTAAVDVADRTALRDLVEAIPAERPLRGVLHAAGVLRDGVVGSLTDEHLDEVLRPKVDGAWHLHELTAGLDLSVFVLFSSVAGLVGSPGQANYAAANAALDALAQVRRAAGLAGQSLVWGPWDGVGMTAEGGRADRHRGARLGLRPFSAAQGMAAFEAAVRSRLPVPVAARLGSDVPGDPAQLSRGLGAPRPRRPTVDRRQDVLLDLVRRSAADVLGHHSRDAVDPSRGFLDLGFDSLTAVELRNRLADATGTVLPATLVFDHPTPAALARHLSTDEPDPVEPVVAVDGDPVVIVGMACRFPGAVASAQDLWDLVVSGREGRTAPPRDRGWDLTTFPLTAGGFLDRAGEFDAEFFGVSPREASAMDPQQRLMLETSWEAVEQAGIDPSSLRGREVGVFAGVMYQDYGSRLSGRIPDGFEGYVGSGSAGSVVSGRVAYVLGLAGPAVTVDTACSSSLVAMHLAGQALRAGECELALAGGVTVMATPSTFTEFARQGGLAADGRCKPFAAGADGVGWGEGVGVVVLERWSDARRNGHRVLAVVRGSAVNQDGASTGLTAPNGPSQQRVIRRALARAGIAPDQVDVVEAHGTGTRLGDPIEAQALLATYGQRAAAPVWLGSVKSNIGHTQAAAGVAGVLKMVMAMRHGVLPKSLHSEEPTPEVDWSSGSAALLTANVAWPAGGRARRAAVSSFGISGTNAHLVLEEPPTEEPAPIRDEPSGLVVPWVVSARSAADLAVVAGRLADVAAAPVDVGWSLACTRAALPHRAVLLGTSAGELLDGVAALAAGERPADLVTATARPGALVAVLSGQGGLRIGAGRELYRECPEFAREWDVVRPVVEEFTGPGLEHALWAGSAGTVTTTSWAQPALFALQMSLSRVLSGWGVRPRWWIGHSVGEFAAACAAGALSLRDAARLVAARGALMGELPAGGTMVSVRASAAEVAATLVDGVEVAAVNSPGWVVLSGGADAVSRVAEVWRGRGRRVRPLQVGHAFHSSHVEPVLDRLAELVAQVSWQRPESDVVSTVTGGPVGYEELSSPEHWIRHARQPVRFADAVGWVAARGVTGYLELGPDAALSPLVRDCLGDRDMPCVPVLRADRPEPRTLVTALARLHAHGHDVDWDAYFRPHTPRPVGLPTYPFRRRHFWLHPTAGSDVVTAGLEPTGHPLLTAAVHLPDEDGWVFTGRLSPADQPWLAEHAVHGVVVFPGTGFVELAACVAQRLGAGEVEELTLSEPLPVPADGVALRVRVGAPDESGRRPVAVHARPATAPDWTRHATGVLSGPGDPDRFPADSPPWPSGPPDLDLARVEDMLTAAGFRYGDAFRGLRAGRLDGESVLVEAELPEQVDGTGFVLHPALLDAVLHGVTGCPGIAAAGLPFAWRGVWTAGRGTTTVRVRITRRTPTEVALAGYDETGAPRFAVESLTFRARAHDPLHRVRWRPADRVVTAGRPDVVVPGAVDFPQAPTVVVACDDGSDLGPDVVAATHQLARRVLRTIQAWLASPAPASRLVVRTRGAIRVADGDDVADLAAAAVHGLVRSVQAEYPDRVVLVDSDDGSIPDGGEPVAAVRAGRVWVPRVAPTAGADRPTWDPAGTLLITGGSGAIGALVARHAVEVWGVRHLVLLGRTSPPVDELLARGASVRVVRCDVSDGEALREVVEGLPALRGVVHAAGVLRDRLVEGLTAEHLAEVLRPKVDGAWHLHELTADLDLSVFAVFSSAAGVLGGPGQANYAAANAFLDGLAEFRRARGLPATSLAWGLWDLDEGMAARLGDADRRRIARSGMIPLDRGSALRSLDAALHGEHPVVLPVRLDAARLRERARAGDLPALWRDLVPVRPQAPARAAGLRERLAGRSRQQRFTAVLATVRAEVAAVLGHASTDPVPADRVLTEAGLDSLMAVDLRNRLVALTGVRLPATAVFDHPTPGGLAEHITDAWDPVGEPVDAFAEFTRIVADLRADPDTRAGLTARLRVLLADPPDDADASERIRSATDDELLAFIDNEL
ncbi:SDR family NAD(P)-dependent oxidoreductase [Embleya sp. AB8]|uniref:SDR family NAD(P)-dependent oxidoreductase n=1 Tax=Embleya sp. AB8 TaxID=3156304 RepID=UPI003C72EBED